MSRILLTIAATLPSVAVATCDLASYAGCYSDAPVRPVGFLALVDDSSMTLTDCLYSCASAGFPVLAATAHSSPSPQGFCYCGPSVSSNATRVADANCNVPCPGNASQSCGGVGYSSTWTLSCTQPLPPQPIGPPLPPGAACSQAASQQFPFCNISLPLEARVSDLVSRITLFEAGPQLTSRQSPAIPRLGIPPFYWGTNAIHGITNREDCLPVPTNASDVRCATSYPSAIALAATWNDALWRAVGETTGREMRAYSNLDPTGTVSLVSWGPTINIVRDPRWGRIQETCGEDPVMCGRFGSAVSTGLQVGVDPRYMLVSATLKHLAVYSLEQYTDGNQTWMRQTFDALVSPADLNDTYLPAFQAAIQEGGASGVMYACNSLNGVPCCASMDLEGILDAWGFDGYRSTDGGQVENMIVGHHYVSTIEEAIVDAAAALSDIADGPEYQQSMGETVMKGYLNMSAVQKLLYDTFKIRFRLGLFDPQADQPYAQYGVEQIHTVSDSAAIVQAARESLVLLQNNGSVLPLPLPTAAAPARIAVIGPNGNSTSVLQGSYGQPCVCSPCDMECYPSITAAITALATHATVTYAPGSGVNSFNATQQAAAVALATTANIIIFTLGLDQGMECEQNDRYNITLPAAQLALYAAVRAAAPTVPFVVVLVHGGALAIPEIKADAPAILDAFYPGVTGGAAIADALFGLYNPGGKLPYTVYPPSFQFASNFTHISMTEGVGRTYRYYNGEPALWSFGHGLSYTTWELAWVGTAPTQPLVLSPTGSVLLDVELTNTGAMDGDDVLQLFFAPVAGSYDPAPVQLPSKQLLDFARLHAQSGAAPTQYSFNLSATSLLMVAADGTRSVYPGNYTITITNGVDQTLTLPLVVTPA